MLIIFTTNGINCIQKFVPIKNIRQIHFGIIRRRNFFNYEQFSTQFTKKPEPPKRPDNFKLQYKRRPLYWMVRGTDVLKEHQQLCLLITGYGVIFTIVLVFVILRLNERNPDRLFLRFMRKIMRDHSPEGEAIDEMKKELYEMNILQRFYTKDIGMSNEIQPINRKKDYNIFDINKSRDVLPRDQTDRNQFKSKLKNTDDAIREQIKSINTT